MFSSRFLLLSALLAPLALLSAPSAAAAGPLAAQTLSRSDFTVTMASVLYPSDIQDCYAKIAPALPPAFTALFSDVSVSHPAAPAICVGMFTGMIDGNPDGSFHPDAPITVAAASKMVAHAYGFTAPSAVPTGKPWYEASLWSLKMRGILPMNAEPGQTLTRTQVVTMLEALAKTERFPADRTVGSSETQSGQEAYAAPAHDQSAVALTDSVDPVVSPDTSEETVRTRRYTDHPSRRTLREQTEQARETTL